MIRVPDLFVLTFQFMCLCVCVCALFQLIFLFESAHSQYSSDGKFNPMNPFDQISCQIHISDG